jgi:AcrR family transcriptional regulator
MVRQLRAEQTRAAIITAAADLFDRRGYESTSLSDIVDHARVTKGALYFHFAAKQDLAHAILELLSDHLRRIGREMDNRGCSALEALIRSTFSLARLAQRDPVLGAGLRLVTGNVPIPPGLPHPFTQCMVTASRRLREAVKEADVHPDVDIEGAAHTLVAALVGIRVVGTTLDPATRRPRRLGDLWRLSIRSGAGAAAPPLPQPRRPVGARAQSGLTARRAVR